MDNKIVLTETQKAVLKILLTTILALVAALTGVTVYDGAVIVPRYAEVGPVTGPVPQATAGTLGGSGTTSLRALNVRNNVDVGGALHVGGTLSAVGATDVTGALSVGSTLTATGLIGFNGVQMSGPIRFGSASAISGTLIAHGIGTTPTVCLLNPTGYVTTTYSVRASNATSITVAVVDLADPAAATVYWLCGK